ncbi:MAG TPA: hypothetical protein VIY52_18825, partial [Streptosporangiaceae bacterium]
MEHLPGRPAARLRSGSGPGRGLIRAVRGAGRGFGLGLAGLGLAGRGLAGLVVQPVQQDAQADQLIQGGDVELAGHHRDHRRVAGHPLGGEAVQPGGAVAAGHGRGGAVRG